MGVKVREKRKGSGEYWIFINHQGKRKSKKIGKDKRLANEVAKKIAARLVLGDMDLSSSEKEIPKFRDFLPNCTTAFRWGKVSSGINSRKSQKHTL